MQQTQAHKGKVGIDGVEDMVVRLRIQLRSFDAICRLVESNVGIGIVPQTTARRARPTMAINVIQLTDRWAVRELTICIRGIELLTSYARQLVAHLRSDLQPEALEGEG